MITEISINEWMEIQHTLRRIDSWNICPKDASFSLAGETHTVYTDGEHKYKSISGNGFGSWYKYTDEDNFDEPNI